VVPNNRSTASWVPTMTMRSGHYPFLEEPDRFAAVVAGFLSSVTGNKSHNRRDLRLHHRRPAGASLALSPEKTMEAGTPEDVACAALFWPRTAPPGSPASPWMSRRPDHGLTQTHQPRTRRAGQSFAPSCRRGRAVPTHPTARLRPLPTFGGVEPTDHPTPLGSYRAAGGLTRRSIPTSRSRNQR
jgi:hypothetical protein